MTLWHRPTFEQLLDLPLGAAVELEVLGAASDARAQAAAVNPPAWLPLVKSAAAHVTVSFAEGARWPRAARRTAAEAPCRLPSAAACKRALLRGCRRRRTEA
jgi:hypothetical protein